MGKKSASGFTSSSTAEDVVKNVDLNGKIIFITGGNSGIGKETARVLSKKGAHVIITCRTLEKCEEANKEISAENEKAQISCIAMDLSSFKSIKSAVDQFNSMNLPLHILICNAGIMCVPYEETEDGFESQFGVNHLGHFLLTNLLLPKLKEGQPSRVVVVSSLAHKYSSIMFDDLKGKDTWYPTSEGKNKAYGQSKTANILFAFELNKRMKKEQLQIYSFSLHPGFIDTNLFRHQKAISTAIKLGKLFLKSIPQGAATSVYCATAEGLEEHSGFYFKDSNLTTCESYAIDDENAKRLWELSEKLVSQFLSSKQPQDEDSLNTTDL